MTTALAVVGDDERPTVVLINVGTPDAPTPSAVRRYLRAFLSDARVIDLPALARWLLLHLVILPLRPRRSAALYRAIWTQQGSPLLVHGRALADALQAQLPEVRVVLGMRYGEPSLARAVAQARGRVVVVPLFPQEASATTGSALAETYRLLGAAARVPAAAVVPPFFHDDGFVEAVASPIVESTSAGVDAILLSYHGVPVSQVQRTALDGHTCGGDDAAGCCAALGVANAGCYRAQCLATSRALMERLRGAGVMAPVATSFQSRLGRARWIGPSPHDAIATLARSGVKRLVVACPSFVADCLETLEEIGVQARAQFLAAGGEHFTLVPCLNADPRFVEVLARLVADALGRSLPPVSGSRRSS